MKIAPLLAHVHDLETEHATALRDAAERLADAKDVHYQCLTFAATVDKRLERLAPLQARYAGKAEWATADFPKGHVLLEALRALYLRSYELDVTWVMVLQAAMAARDPELRDTAKEAHTEVEIQAKWFLTRIKTGAPQALVVA